MTINMLNLPKLNIQDMKESEEFFDLPMQAKRVGIFVKRQRNKCPECNVTFFVDLPDMDENRPPSLNA